MIESIRIANVATFLRQPECLTNLSQFNYIFGSNGTGKTTISRVIADHNAYPECSVSWRNGIPLETKVLNLDFVEKNFNQLKGVFTLGEKQKDTFEKIRTVKEELDREQVSLVGLKKTLEGLDGTGGKKGELDQLDEEFKEKCWLHKKKHDEKFHRAFTGYRNNAQKFMEKVLNESKDNKAPEKSVSELELQAESVFGVTPSKEDYIPTYEMSELLAHESNPILLKPIIGKEDVDIAAMIKKLGSSDWVRQGLTFYERNDQVCPFCQQSTTDAFAASLADYFDESFETDCKTIGTLISEYTTDASNLQKVIAKILDNPGKFLDVENLKSQKIILDQTISANNLVLDRKKKEPSQVVELKTLDALSTEIKELIDAANNKVTNHNNLVDNLETEKRDLTAQVWRLVLSELEFDLKQYRTKKDALEKAVANLNTKIEHTNSRIGEKEREISDLERQATSIQPTIDDINNILSRFGFDSFKLMMGADKKSYRLVRQNGEDARDTLSEGEKSFVVFLYFYHLLRGSMSEDGITTDRIVVFDDPVSSLDSDILFVVSSLIREVCEKVRENRGNIRQVFVFTHNIYFHKEVTFNNRRERGPLLEETFWIVRKDGPVSKIERHKENPIRTLYELLWMDVRNPSFTNLRIENSLRRILEYYFKILGSYDRDIIYAQFDGEEKLICKSLFSWVNAGSHHAHDDIYMTPSEKSVNCYLEVFRAIFEKTGHNGHYKMMMGDDFVEEVPENALQH